MHTQVGIIISCRKYDTLTQCVYVTICVIVGHVFLYVLRE